MKNLILSLFFGFTLILFTNQLFSQVATFDYTGATQQFTVPDAVYSLSLTTTGGAGGTGNMGATVAAGGLGAEASASFAVTPGDILTIVVGNSGGNGTFGSTGGGGGGGSFVVGPGDVLLLAAGGGGGGGCNGPCIDGLNGEGFGGTGVGGTGSDGGGGAGFNSNGASGGGGATGGSSYANGSGGGTPGGGSLGFGGYGGGGGGYFFGGGGGGYSGGNGAVSSGAAGGGTSYVDASGTDAIANVGINSGNGQIVISYAVSVPTLSQWGIIILSLLFLIFGVVAIRTKIFTLA